MAVGRIVRHDLFRRHQNPFVFEPRVPAIFGITLVARLDLELGFDGVSDAATEQRLGVGVAIRLEMIIGPL